MPKCVRCGMSGFNLKLDERGLCEDCAEMLKLGVEIDSLSKETGLSEVETRRRATVSTAPAKQKVRQPSSGEIAVKVFLILSCIVWLFGGLVPLLWCIPITVTYFKRVKNNEPIRTGFKVVVLIFVNLIAGIILLCMNTD